jgi:hypothetical protein
VKKLMFVLLAASIFGATGVAVAQTTQSPDPVHAGVASAMAKIQHYSTSKSLGDLYSAIYQMQLSLDIGINALELRSG